MSMVVKTITSRGVAYAAVAEARGRAAGLRAAFVAQVRERLTQAVEDVLHEQSQARREVAELRHRQNELVRSPDVQKVHARRADIELEAELKRLRLVRNAVTASRGLEHAGQRPGAWWFRVVCPDGLWFRETVETAEYYLEPL